MKKLLFFTIMVFIGLIRPQPLMAVTDPLSSPNNSFGIHITDESDIDAAAALVNSTGGQWGYVTLVIPQNDLNTSKWQAVFDKLRRSKLIPLVRLATFPTEDYWSKPTAETVDQWVGFLNSLNWVIKNRYVILFNEPNHLKEWGNDLNPAEYVNIVKLFHQKLKSVSSDFFILPAGFDTAAPNSDTTMSAVRYWDQMYSADNRIFNLFDGWNSHSYPNPGFSGPVTGSGFGSIRSYLAEIDYLSQYSLPSDIPVFITETGWQQQAGQVLGVQSNYMEAFQTAWNHPQIIAVTPFVLNYTYPPFTGFSWKKPDSQDYYPQYYSVQGLSKTKGVPQQIHASHLEGHNFPDQLVVNSYYHLKIKFTNTGQSIWDYEDFSLRVTGSFPENAVSYTPIKIIEPFQSVTFIVSLNTSSVSGEARIGFQMQHHDQVFGEKFETAVNLVPPTDLTARLKLWFTLNCPWCDRPL